MEEVERKLISKIKVLSETIWEHKADNPKIEDWLKNFETNGSTSNNERLHALYLLSHFMYFGARTIRELLKALYRDVYRYPIIEAIRKTNGDTTDLALIQAKFHEELGKTRFLGMGNPSESGCHLLYYFRQENELPRDLFIHTHEIFSRSGEPVEVMLKDKKVTRYVFIDDFCGSGEQAKQYSTDVLKTIKHLSANNKDDIELSYYVLFATETGLDCVEKDTLFDNVNAVFRLDSSYKCFHDSSRYFIHPSKFIDKDFSREMCLKYGSLICKNHPFGYKDGQLLIGFNYNTPDNTLPIIWGDDGSANWVSIFKRYPKINWKFV